MVMRTYGNVHLNTGVVRSDEVLCDVGGGEHPSDDETVVARAWRRRISKPSESFDRHRTHLLDLQQGQDRQSQEVVWSSLQVHGVRDQSTLPQFNSIFQTHLLVPVLPPATLPESSSAHER